MKSAKILVLAALAISVAACCGCRKSKSGVPLYGTEWKLAQLYDTPVSGTGGYTMTLTAEGKISGRGDCNHFTGSFTSKKHELKIAENMVSTRMMCLDQERENRFMAMLREVDSFSIDGTRLMLIKDGEVIAIFDPAPAEKPAEEPEKKEFQPLGPPIMMMEK
jgi:heat shock protein HslJ